MKLWVISQSVHGDYDTYDSAVVAAETEDEARLIHPNGSYVPVEKWSQPFRCWARSPEQVAVRYIGEASPGTELGVIVASFNAG